LIVLSTLVMDWFVASIDGVLDIARITFDLREARACSPLGPCAVVPMSMVQGSYPTAATVAFWSSLGFALVVLYQAGSRVLSGYANETLSKVAHVIGSIAILTAVGAGYLFGPDLETGTISIERSWGPSTMLLGLFLGHLAIYFSRDTNADEVPYKPIDPIPQAIARNAARPATVPPMQTPRAKTATIPPTNPPTKKPSAPVTPIPAVFKGKLQFSVVTCDITPAGIDARREDGHTVLVLWRDVVGVVARRMPPDYDSVPFLDVVSTAGMTLRLLPWTRITGEVVEGGDIERARALAKLLASRCTQAKLDKASQAFVDTDKPPAQLPTLDMLAKHDQALT
jgi:hypothetical protein